MVQSNQSNMPDRKKPLQQEETLFLQSSSLFSARLFLVYLQIVEVESRTQGSRQRPRTQKKIRGQGQPFQGQTLSRPRTGMLEAKDRNARGQGQGPRTQAQVLSKKKKKVFTKIFQAISAKKRFPKNFSSALQNFNNSKNSAVLEPRTGQFSRTWGLEAKAKDFKLRPRGQGRPRGLHLWQIVHDLNMLRGADES